MVDSILEKVLEEEEGGLKCLVGVLGVEEEEGVERMDLLEGLQGEDQQRDLEVLPDQEDLEEPGQ